MTAAPNENIATRILEDGTNPEVVTLQPPSKKRVVVNSTTDTGLGFELGNSAISYPDPWAMGFNIAVGVIALNARRASELVNQEPAQSPYPAWFNKFAQNMGASMLVSATGLVVSSTLRARDGGFGLEFQSDWNQPVTATAATILLAFGLANGSRGFARGCEPGGLKQKFLDATAVWCATFGVLSSVPDSPIAVKGLLVGGAVLETATAFGAKKIPTGTADAIFAVGAVCNAFNAASSGDTKMVVANCLFASAYIALGALRKSSGLYQFFKGKPASPEPSL